LHLKILVFFETLDSVLAKFVISYLHSNGEVSHMKTETCTAVHRRSWGGPRGPWPPKICNILSLCA